MASIIYKQKSFAHSIKVSKTTEMGIKRKNNSKDLVIKTIRPEYKNMLLSTPSHIVVMTTQNFYSFHVLH
jgi:hypothetical protein